MKRASKELLRELEARFRLGGDVACPYCNAAFHIVKGTSDGVKTRDLWVGCGTTGCGLNGVMYEVIVSVKKARARADADDD